VFKILLPQKLKDESIRDMKDFIEFFQSKLGSVPTSYGCLVFLEFGYDEEKLLEFAKQYKSSEALAEIKKAYDKGAFLELKEGFDEQTLNAIVSAHADVIGWTMVKLLIPILPSRLKRVKLFADDIYYGKKEGLFFSDAEGPRKANLRYLDIKDVEAAMNDNTDEEGNLDIEMLWHTILEYTEDEEWKEGYVLILHGEVEAEITLKKAEAKIDEALSPIKNSIFAKSVLSYSPLKQ
jgi:hypothetical protein